jgi:hypothetical protein
VAQAAPTQPATFLILNTCVQGDPLNIAAPGSLEEAALRSAWASSHPAQVAPVAVQLGSVSTTAARPWGALPEALRQRMAFIHHRTFAETHTEHPKVMRLFDGLRRGTGNGTEMLPSAIGEELGSTLGTIQREPITLGDERVTFQGHFVENLSPLKLKALFGGTSGSVRRFADLRAQTLDAAYGSVKSNGTAAQREYLERVATSRSQAAKLGEQLAGDLLDVPVSDDARAQVLVPGLVEDYPFDPIDQVLTAVALVKYKVTPVVTIHLPFGGDNHTDPDFADETLQVQGGVQLMGLVWERLVAENLAQSTTFASLNTFGRTFLSTGGRAHNSAHHVMTLFGPSVRPGIAGGPVRGAHDYEAAAFNGTTGAVGGTADVPTEKTFAVAARTLLKAVGVADERAEVRVPGVRPVAALVS